MLRRPSPDLPGSSRTRAMAIAVLAAAIAPSALAAGGHQDPVTPVALALALILVAAKAGGEVAMRLGQPAVLGELLAGVALGNVALTGFDGLAWIKRDAAVEMLAGVGVLVLLFEVGLESTVGQMMKVGMTALAVAVVGVVAPFALGWLAGAWLLPNESAYAHAFLGAVLCATSVGITARVFQDLGASKSPEARIILGAAVIDDVLGLIVLAVMGGIIAAADSGSTVSYGAIGAIIGKSILFLVGALIIGVRVSPRIFAFASRLRAPGILLATGLGLCFLLSWMAGSIGLAPIIGAFAAGLILEDVHYKPFKDRGEHGIEELVHPIAGFLVPVFFVLMGMRTDLGAFLQPGVLGLAAGLTIAAIIGKQVCGLAAGRGVDRLTVGFGMVPRGEVGLIFAGVGASMTLGGDPVISPDVYSAVVVMVIATTLATPPALRWRIARR